MQHFIDPSICRNCGKLQDDCTCVRQLNLPLNAPKKNNNPHVWDLVIQDMQERDAWGAMKYNTHLQGFNDRDSLVDLYQELLDAVVYIRKLIWEEERNKENERSTERRNQQH